MGEGTRDPLGTLGKLRGYSGDFRTTGSCTLLFLYGYLNRMQWKALELGFFWNSGNSWRACRRGLSSPMLTVKSVGGYVERRSSPHDPSNLHRKGTTHYRLDCEAQLAKDQRSLVPCESE